MLAWRMIDLALLRIVKYRADFYKFRGRVPDAAMDAQTVAIMADFQAYFDGMPERDTIDLGTFLPMFRSRHPSLSTEQRNAFETILTNALTVDVDDDAKQSILRSMLELRLGTQLANLLAKFDAGDLPNIQGELSKALDEFKADAGIRKMDYIRDDIGDLLAEEVNDSGLRWRLQCLRDSVRGLRPGDFGIIAGRPDRGKTTMIASELTH